MQVLCGCGRFMVVTRNGVTVEEVLDDWAPYKLWDADRWQCPECGALVITGFGVAPLAEHWQPSYASTRERLQPVVVARHRGPD
jgi:sarcosine oxidase delta subunit